MNNREKQAARSEKKQHKIEAGFMSALYPHVASISISMLYRQKGIRQPLPRTVNFFPSSYALFNVDCLSKECISGGFDFNRIIATMVRERKKTSSGELDCEGGDSEEDHSSVVYDIAIQYI